VSDPRSGLESRLLAWMAERPMREDDALFGELAGSLFELQFERCLPYQRFCEARGVEPKNVGDWRRIPAVPTGAFKEMALRCFPAERTCKTFRTSGTANERRGELHLDTLALYEASLMASLETLLLAETDAGITLRVLAPSDDEAPDSSLSHMFGALLRSRGDAASGFDVVDGELRLDTLAEAIGRAATSGQPLGLCGTAFAFVHLIDALAARGESLACPSDAFVMETGGFKGRSRELPQSELYDLIGERLGVPQRRIVNQYGMTELGSQFYDSVLCDPEGPRRKLGPPWTRVRFVDPTTGEDVREGEVGMVVIHDLANTGTVAAIQTADIGRRVLSDAGHPIGFEILGREPGAEARGCSIAADVMLGPGAG
jgi:hypothetical protein